MSNPHHGANKVSAKQVAITTFAIDAVDLLMLGATAVVTGSALLAAQMLQGIANITTDAFLLIGLKRSKKHADAAHPFGYGRELYVWALLAATIMFMVTAGLSFYVGISRLLNPEPISNIPFALIILAISLVSNGYGVILSVRRMRHVHSDQTSLVKRYLHSPYVETKTAFITDFAGAISAVISLAGLIAYFAYGIIWVDAIGAIMIGVLIAVFSLLLIINIKDLLVGRGISKTLQNKLIKVITELPYVHKVTSLLAENLGPDHMIVNVDVVADKDIEFDQVQNVRRQVKEVIQKTLPMSTQVQVEVFQDIT